MKDIIYTESKPQNDVVVIRNSQIIDDGRYVLTTNEKGKIQIHERQATTSAAIMDDLIMDENE